MELSRGTAEPGVESTAQEMLRICRAYDSSQWKPPEVLRLRQWLKLLSLLDWSDRFIPFYRQRFREAGIKPAKISGMEEFRTLPLLSRKDLEDAGLNGLKPGGFPCVPTRTSGTSGRKLTIWIAPDYGSLVVFPLWRRALKAGGLRAGDRYQRITYLGRGVYPTLGRTQDIELRDATRDILAQLYATQPNAVLAIPATLEQLGLEILGQGAEPPESLRRIFTCGEHLNQASRHLIRQAFALDPVDQYAATEVSSGIAWQCEQREGYHVNIDNLLVEILDDRNEPVLSGKKGRLVVTDLSSRPVPLIRYDIGDLASWQSHQCRCGRTLPCLKEVIGRDVERIRLRSGEWLTVHDIAGALYEVPDALQFQVRERHDGGIVVDIVMRPDRNGEKALDDFRRALMKTVLATVDWKLNPVRSIKGELFAKRKLLHAAGTGGGSSRPAEG